MKLSRIGRSARALSLALLLVALGTGVPVHAHADHEGGEVHIGPPEHSHGVDLVRHEMRLERAAPPVFVAVETGLSLQSPPAPVWGESVSFSDGKICDSRAPPDVRPRAPPL